VQGSEWWRHDTGMDGGLAPTVARRSWTPAGRAAAYSRVCVTPDQRALEDDVLVRLRQRLLGYARRGASPDVAEDLVQETFVLLTTKYAHVLRIEERVRLGIGILSKLKLGHWRKSQRRGEASAVDAAKAEDGRPGPEEEAARRLLVERLRVAVGALSGRCRELVRLKLEDRTFPEIAAILKAKINTVYSWDHRCLQRLRELMAEPEVRR
jgi:RNA polymerase sigma factor (sigma-70 family)